jgi:hypothetical protein
MTSLLLLCAARPDPATLLDHAFEQWKATPEMRIEDAYKWLFHATLGGEHAVVSEDGPRRWLDREWSSLGAPTKGEPELVPLAPDGKLVRINLRPYKSRGGDKEMLLWAFVLSAERFKSDKGSFVREWEALGARLGSEPVRHLTRGAWSLLDRRVRREGYPAIGHSAEYESRYRPAYRVVLRETVL